MPSLFSQQYNKQSRTISGVGNLLFQDDVILLCNTTTGAVSLTLLDIPANVWSTQSKLYVVDSGNNASVNNITINAPVGFTVNGQASTTINTNGGCVIINPVSNTNYLSIGGAGGGGACCTITPITNANMLILINTNAVEPTKLYLITDAGYSDGGVLVQGITTNSISVEGRGYFYNADYQLVGNYSGVSGFNTALGIWYSTYAGAVSVGDVVIWNNRHYKNLTGVWYDGLNNPNSDAVNWQLLNRTATTGYIFDIGFVRYDVLNNQVVYRADEFNNEVELGFTKFIDSLTYFPFGRDNYTNNKVFGNSVMNVCNSFYFQYIGNVCSSESVIEIQNDNNTVGTSFIHNVVKNGSSAGIKNSTGNIIKNILDNNSTFAISKLLSSDSNIENNFLASGQLSLAEIVNGSNIISNCFTSGSYLQVQGTASKLTFELNSLNSNGRVMLDDVDGGSINNCVFENSGQVAILNRVFTWSHQDCRIDKLVSTFAYNIDMSVDYSLPLLTLTIPVDFEYIGNWVLDNGNLATQIAKISYASGLPPTHYVNFRPRQGTQVPFAHTLVAGAVINNLCCDAIAPVNNLTGRVNGCDFIQYVRSGDFWIRTNLVLLA